MISSSLRLHEAGQRINWYTLHKNKVWMMMMMMIEL